MNRVEDSQGHEILKSASMDAMLLQTQMEQKTGWSATGFLSSLFLLSFVLDEGFEVFPTSGMCGINDFLCLHHQTGLT